MTFVQSQISRVRHSYKLAKVRQLATRASRVRDYCARHSVVKLNIGCGPAVKRGWLNIDIDPRLEGAIYMDATQPLGLRDGSVDFAYSEHMIEHVGLDDAIAMLRELHRVLRPGGMLRIATPELDKIVQLKNGKLDARQENYVRLSNMQFGSAFERSWPQNACYAINRTFREWGHKFIYDRSTLAWVLSHTGFSDVRFCEIGQSGIAEFRNLETHGSYSGEEFNQFETMIAEATREARVRHPGL
jgi:predicted SAM-dependent methyltransferase